MQMTKERYANIIPMKEMDTLEKRLLPFSVYDTLRQTTPVRYDADRDCWDLFRYEDVHFVLKNPVLFSSRRMMGVGDRVENLLVMDPPKHTQMRNLVNKAFTPKAINDLASHIKEITESLLAEAKSSGKIDIVHDLATPLPVIVIAELLGVPAEDRQLFKEWSDVLVKGPANNSDEAYQAVIAEREQVVGQLTRYFADILKARSQKRESDLVSLLLDAEIEGHKLSAEDVISFCILLLVAGNETTTNLITNGVRLLIEDPERQEVLRTHREWMPEAVEEILRYYPPIQAIGRITVNDVEIGGQKIAAGSQVVSWVASANRDEQKFDQPSTFVPNRKPNPHLSFGFGIHFCLGAPLARLEGRIAFETLLDTFRSMQKGGEYGEPIQSPFVFGIKKLPIMVQ